MNSKALLHLSASFFCFPIGDKEVVIRLRAARNDLEHVMIIYTDNKYEWGNGRRKLTMEKLHSTTDFDWYETRLQLSDTRLAYIFELRSEGKRWFYCEDGVDTTFEFDLAFFSYFQYPFINPSDVHRVPAWTVGATAYEIFPERFAAGDVRKDRSYVNLPWGDIPLANSFAGGDLFGVVKKIDYLEDLGVRLLCLTPVFASGSNHKYDVTDYYAVDERFGGDQALSQLVAAAHKKGMRVVLDGPFNHCANEHPMFQDVLEKGAASPYFEWFCPEGRPVTQTLAKYDVEAGDNCMAKFNSNSDEVIAYFCKVGVYWITEYGIDGWRLDTMDELSHTFLRRFRTAVKRANPEALLLGETWHESHPWLRGDQCDGAVNFGVEKACMDFFVSERIGEARFRDRLVNILMRNTDQANAMTLNVLGTHGTERFLTRLSGNTERFMSAYALLFFLPGIPCVYYGDEVGMVGGDMPDCLRCFPWEEAQWDYALYACLRRLIKLRERPALAEGTFSIGITDDMIRIVRRCGEDVVTLYVNRSQDDKQVEKDGQTVRIRPDSYWIDDESL